MHVRVALLNLFLWKALTEAMANIKLDKNVICLLSIYSCR